MDANVSSFQSSDMHDPINCGMLGPCDDNNHIETASNTLVLILWTHQYHNQNTILQQHIHQVTINPCRGQHHGCIKRSQSACDYNSGPKRVRFLSGWGDLADPGSSSRDLSKIQQGELIVLLLVKVLLPFVPKLLVNTSHYSPSKAVIKCRKHSWTYYYHL